MDDEQLLALKKNGGVIQVVGFASYVKADSKERTDALAKLRDEFGINAQGGCSGRGGGGGGRGRGADGTADGAARARTCPVESADGTAPQGTQRWRRRRPGAGACRGLSLFLPESARSYDKRLAEGSTRSPGAPEPT